ncbi:phosphoserine phosphatase SerB [Sneathiella sp. P13V-1]|uniref:phosphoserine phosphatase SerB n=1 Tax=Sneathiella sp. P13V-1 TaxID=2697366 RepID=UPI00187B85B2|nr:phosphoserine phosphatase SerB [Sneathiella sp. P13V-1]MBE7637886.1 phosphoserine phosphatase SerB [Sneathiella sp. P13V-1]
MNSVLTLVANPEDLPSLSSTLSTAEARLQELGATDITRTWLKDGFAVDLAFTAELNSIDIAADLEAVDWCLQPVTNRKKKLLLADMDSTIITVECIDELADFAGLKEQVSEITEKAMRGELEFDDAFKSRVAMLTGLKEEVLDKTFDERVKLTAGARTLIQTLKKDGCYSALVSGGFTYFTGRVRDLVGFDMDDANELLFENGALTGKAAEPILNSSAKLANLNRLLEEKGLDRSQSVAIGDGANDIPMIEAAGLGVAFHAKPKAQDAADASIRYGDLTTLLYYQGYKSIEFVED